MVWHITTKKHTEMPDATDVLWPLDDDRDIELNWASRRPRPMDGVTVPTPLSKLVLVSECVPLDDEDGAADDWIDTDDWFFISCSILMSAPRPRPD